MAYITFDGNGYAYTAIAQLVLAVYAAAHLALVRDKSTSARWLLYFFLCLAASSVAYFLINAVSYWGVLFAPLQDALILLGGVCMVRFAYAFPVEQPRRWKLIPLSFMIVLAALALAVSLAWLAYGFIAPDPWRRMAEAYYLLLPVGILTSVSVFVVRAVQMDERPALPGGGFGGRSRRAAAILLRPYGRYAQAHLLFAWSVLLGALPAVAAIDAVARALGRPLDTLLIGPGSILAVAAIFFAYLHYAPEWSSFSVRLISIALVTLLVVLNAVGVFLIMQVSQRVWIDAQMLAFTTGALDLASIPADAPAALAYVIDWGATTDATPRARLLYRHPLLDAAVPADLLPAAAPTDIRQRATFRDAAAHLATIWALEPSAAADNWAPPPSAVHYSADWIGRFLDPARGPPKLFMGFPVIQQDRWYEIGIDSNIIGWRIFNLTVLLIMASFVGLVLTLTGHMLLIRPTLISPLERLLAGVRRATGGDLNAALPVVYRDEVGLLTESFNVMTARLHDLTEDLEQKVAARTVELNAAKEHAEQASRAKSAFLANVSHELRTPLTAMLGYAELVLRRPSLDANMRVEITTIYESGQQLLVLINDMLDMTRIEADVMVFHRRRANLRELVDQVLLIHRLATQAKHLTLQIEFAAMTPEVIETDVDKVKRILMNLIGNAIKFTEAGGVTLSIACHPIDPAGAERAGVTFVAAGAPTERLLVTEVQDTGIGIPPALHEQIFAEFTQINTTTPEAAQGLGLGLSISRRLARLMGGDLTVTSSGAPGAGACFRLTVPVTCIADPAPAPAPRPADTSPQPAPLAAAGVTMLVAEDIDANRALLAYHLRAAGCTVYEARNGQEALDKWLQVRPAVLWLDMRMPVLSGQEVVRQVRAYPSGAATRIVAVTASAFEEDRAALLALGCDEFLRKPYHRQDVIDLVARFTAAAAAGQPESAAATPQSAGAAPAPDSGPHVWLHQLRNGIGAIGGLAEILRDDAFRLTEEEANRCLTEIEASTQRIGATMVDLGRWIDEVAPSPRRRAQ